MIAARIASFFGLVRDLRALRRVAAVVLAVVVGVGSCATPSIPIPPPEVQQMTFTVDVDAGSATFQYGPSVNYGGALVYIYNRTQGRGVIETARDDGSVGPTAPFPAVVNDEVSITFEAADQAVSTCVVVRDGVPSQICGG